MQTKNNSKCKQLNHQKEIRIFNLTRQIQDILYVFHLHITLFMQTI